MFVVLLFLPCNVGAQAGVPELKALSTPVIVIDRATGTGRALLYIRNGADSPKTLSLSGAINSTTKPTDARISFISETGSGEGSPVYDFSIPSKVTMKVWAIVTDAWDSGDFEADVNNNDVKLGKIRIRRFPFGVKLDGPSPDKLELALVAGEPKTIILKNDDPISYSLSWRLFVDGRDVCGDNLTIMPNGIGVLKCQPSVSFGPSRIQDLFKQESKDGNLLLLYPQAAGSAQAGVSPWKTFPVKASLSYFSQFTAQFWSYVAIVLILIFGGVTSLILSQALPNRLQRLKLREQLNAIAKTTANLSTHVDSKLQVLLRVERSSLDDLLQSRNTMSPDFATIAAQCSQGISKLSSRVDLVQQVDVVMARLAKVLPQGAPPTRIDEVEASLQKANVFLSKTAPTDTDLQAAQIAISDASGRVDALNQPDASFGQKLAKKILDVKDKIESDIKVEESTFASLKELVPGPYNALHGVPDETPEIAPAFYFSLDMATEKILLMRDYALLVDGMANDAESRKRLQDPNTKSKLVGLLQQESWEALRWARLLLREMKDDVYPERLEELLQKDGASIDVDPSIAYDRAPLELCVRFHNVAVNTAAAREEFTCYWDFGDGLKEKGWNVTHYFQLPTPSRFRRVLPRILTQRFPGTFKESKVYEVLATFRNAAGKQISKLDGNDPVKVPKNLEVRRSTRSQHTERFWIEGLKLTAALIIAVFGLVAGAREQLMKLDILTGLVAVFLVGFGADTIKNLLTSKS